jgi:hypothetical protein
MSIKYFPLPIAALTLGILAGNAQAEVVNVFEVNANCTDCAQASGQNSFPVKGTLTLSNYTAGEELSDANFVSFVYGGSNLLGAYSVTNSGNDANSATTDYVFSAISGVLAAMRASFDVEIFFQQTGSFSDFEPIFNFSTSANGSFDTCAPSAINSAESCFFGSPSDFGNNAIWNPVSAPGQVPLPGTVALLLAGLLGVGLRKTNGTNY